MKNEAAWQRFMGTPVDLSPMVGQRVLLTKQVPRILSADERRALVLAPFPIIRISCPRGNSQAPNWVGDATHQQEDGV